MARLLALGFLLLSSVALADRREVYVEVEAGLGLQLLRDASTATKSAVAPGPGGQLQGFYGLTNTLHVGLYARGFLAPDVAFRDVTPTLQDGSTPTGTLYENAFGAGGGALARWRFDTGYAFAPVVQLELGLAWVRFDKLQLIPTGKTFGIDLPAVDEVTADGRLLLGLEYRLESYVIALHLGGRRVFNRAAQLQFDATLAAGVVF